MTDATAIIVSASLAGAIAGIPAIIASVKVGRVHKDFNSKMDDALRVKGEAEYARGRLTGHAEGVEAEKKRRGK